MRIGRIARRTLLLGLILLLCYAGTPLRGAELEPGSPLKITGNLAQPKDLSGAAFHHNYLVLAVDEGAKLNVLAKASDQEYRVFQTPALVAQKKQELDLEAAASDGKWLYLLGSCSRVRPEVTGDDTYVRNRERLTFIDSQPGRNFLWRTQLTKDGLLETTSAIDLYPLLQADPLIRPFLQLPGKENGLDFEGLAVQRDLVFLGCRGPVLRDNYVPVMVLNFAEPTKLERRVVPLAGRGIRDLLAVDDGILILAGPMGDGHEDFAIYWWNGLDCLPGSGGAGGRVVKLGTLDIKKDAPEALALVSQHADHWELLLALDGDDRLFPLHVPRKR